MSELTFTRDQAWVGGEYELAILLRPADDDRLRRALEALWSFPDLDGCYLLREVEPHAQMRVNASPLETLLCGTARIVSSERTPCRSVVIRLDTGEDWLSFGIPMGSLARILPVHAFPFCDGSDLTWRKGLDEWLCALGRHVFESVNFRLGLIGWTDGSEDDDAARFERSGVPGERWVGYLAPSDRDLQWYPPNRDAPFTSGSRP